MSDALSPDLAPRPPKRGRRWLPTAIVAIIVVAIVALMISLVGSASLFVYEADEAVAERDELGDDRFRLIGSPVEGTIVDDAEYEGTGAVSFTVLFGDTEVDVIHVGDPPDLFQPGVPVFLEGHWRPTAESGVDAFAGGANDGWFFASDSMRVKHDEDYRNDNDERLSEAEQGGQR